jgi:thioredoxin 1
MNPSAIDPQEMTRESLAHIPGPVVVEFGAKWCSLCQAFAPHMQELLQAFRDVQHIKVEDGPGQPFGRSFAVTLWPTLVFVRDGQVKKVLVRPDPDEVQHTLKQIV